MTGPHASEQVAHMPRNGVSTSSECAGSGELRKLLLFGELAMLMSLVLLPVQADAQIWEFQIGWARIDHDYPANATDTGEKVPAGYGVVARRSLPWPNLSMALEYTRGFEERSGAICGGFVQPGDCIPERVGYSGGVSTLSLGWFAGWDFGTSWSVGIRPEVGLGYLRRREEGRETGRDHTERRSAASFGIGVEVGRLISPQKDVWLQGFANWSHLRPILLTACEDCWRMFADPLPKVSIGIGVRWGRLSSVSGRGPGLQ